MKPAITFSLLVCAALASPALADGDAKKGAKVFRKCRNCHTAVEEINKVGPSLVGIVDRPVASVNFQYSDAMKQFASGNRVWDVKTLTIYLKRPKAVVKGTTMAFVGLKKDADIENIIAYLRDPAAAE